eukprot:tig00020848_g14554.t1
MCTPFVRLVVNLCGDQTQKSLFESKKATVPFAELSDDEKIAAMKAFHAADSDNSGYLDPLELGEVLKQMFPRISGPEINRIYSKMDANRSGRITFDEFIWGVSALKWNMDKLVTKLATSPGKPQYEWEIPNEELHLGSKLGEGSYGIVYRGNWRGTTVAIKKLKSESLQGSLLQDFRAEIAILGKLRHPNILLYLGASTIEPHLAIVTEFMDGGSMHDLVHPNGGSKRLPTPTVIKACSQVAKGLNYLHLSKPKIVHRDMKLMNILVDEFGNAKVADFGLACVKPDASQLQEQVGTPVYMAPEVFKGKAYDEKTDVYAFGICMWEMVSSDLPFIEWCTSYDTLKNAVIEGFRPQMPDNVDSGLSSLIQSCWAPDPRNRPSMSDVVKKLMELEKKYPVPATSR